MNRIIFFSLSLGLIALLSACQPKAPETSAAKVFANETDFICGMKVAPEWTDTCHYKGKVYAFCSQSCKEEFQANTASFLSKEVNQ